MVTDNVKHSGLLEIIPGDLTFKFEPNKKMPANLVIKNPSDQRLLYKVRTNQPKKYIVKPSSGLVEPLSEIQIQVVMQAQERLPDEGQRLRDKFLVMSVPVTPDMGHDPQVHNDLFKNTTKGYGDAIVYVVIDEVGGKPSAFAAQTSAAGGAEWSTHTSITGEAGSEVERLQMEVGKLRKQLEMVQMGQKFGAPQNGAAQAQGFSFLHLMLAIVITFAATHIMGWLVGS